MISNQIINIEGAIEWIKTCPFHYTISSMSGGYVHMKLLIPVDERVDVTLPKAEEQPTQQEVANPYVSDRVKALIEQINYTLGEEFANDVSKEPIDAVTRLHELAWALVKETSPDTTTAIKP
jgi:dihydroneopterin aldolase